MTTKRRDVLQDKPGIRLQDLKHEGDFFLTSRQDLIREILGLRLKLKEAEKKAGGLQIKGWWCICDIFNGEEKEKRSECRSCGKPKAVR